MRVLVMGSDPHAGETAALELQESGHEVVRCHDSGGPAFPCKGVGGHCPLDADTIDVALLVREHPWPRPTAYEHGVVCANRMHVPLVVAGKSMLHPYEEVAAEVVPGETETVKACERVANRPLPRHSEIATRALQRVLETAGRDFEAAHAEVARSEGALRVTVTTGEELTAREADVAAVRILAALRRYDRNSPGIDVTFH